MMKCRCHRKPLMMVVETKRFIYSLMIIKHSQVWPEFWGDEDICGFNFLWVAVDRISNEWIDFCMDHGD